MGIYDRDYHRSDYNPPYRGGHVQFRMPQITPMVKWLLIANVTIFLVCVIFKPIGNFIYYWFSVDTSSMWSMVQVWRLVGYQFLHDPNTIMHIGFNMLALYFLGPTLERHWGSKRFTIFYLCCGAAGGVFYSLLVAVGMLAPGMLIGASGAILGLLAACAILFPHFVVFLFLFPVPIRVAAVLFTGLYIFSIFTKGYNAGGNAAHLAGMATGAFYVYLWPKIKAGKKSPSRLVAKLKNDNWTRKMNEYRKLQAEVDRILEKVNAEGVSSLTSKEKKTLSEATRLEQMRNNG